MRRAKRWMQLMVMMVMAAGFTSCSAGGGPGLPPLSVLLFNFDPGFAGVRLNAALELTLSAPVDATTVTPDTVRIFTTTTTTNEPNPGSPAVGKFVVVGNVITFHPRIPQLADLSDAGLRIGFTYAIQVPSSPDVIDPVRTIEGDPNVVTFNSFFTTLNSTVLPAPADITAEPNLNSLSLFFIDQFITAEDSFGTDPCDRDLLPVADRDSPQVVDSDPSEGESGFGTITGIQQGLGTAFVRLDPITLDFSEPVAPWRIRIQNISIRNTNLGGETFDLFFFFRQDCESSRLQITVFDADSAFDQASVPQGRYVLSLTEFSDLAGNPLVNSNTCIADGTFQLSFSTVSSPALPTDIQITFQDNGQDGHVDVGGLPTSVNNPDVPPEHMSPFLGGFAFDFVGVPSPSSQTTNANPGNVGFWTGCEIRYNNGFDPTDDTFSVPDVLRLRGGSNLAGTPLISPLSGNASGRSDPAGSLDGSVASAEAGKVDFFLQGVGTATLFTGDLNTGPISYHYNSFDLLEDTTTGARPRIEARNDSVWPLLIFVEDDATITGDIVLNGSDGGIGYNGSALGNPPRTPGGPGGLPGPGGGRGGDGALLEFASGVESFNGKPGAVPLNVLGPLDQLSQAVAGLANMVTGGGGHNDVSQAEMLAPNRFVPAFQGGGGGGPGSAGGNGADIDTFTTPGQSDQGAGGRKVGESLNFSDEGILATGGSGGGGGGGDDDGSGTDDLGDGNPNADDDGGAGGGGGAGFFGLACDGDVTLGTTEFNDNGTPSDPDDDFLDVRPARIEVVGGRGGSTYATATGNPPAPDDPSDPVGTGEAGGGGAGGGICVLARGAILVNSAILFAFGKQGGNSPFIEAGGRGVNPNTGNLDVPIQGGNGGGGLILFCDSDGVDVSTEVAGNGAVVVGANPDYDLDGDLVADLAAGDPERDDIAEMSGSVVLVGTVWGDSAREPGYGVSQVVTEFFDTLSDSVSYDQIRVLSNAPRFPAGTIRVFLDVTQSGPGGLPDLSTEDPASGEILGPNGFSIEASLTRDMDTGLETGVAQFDSRSLIAANSPALGKRFARVRLVFDVSQIGSRDDLLGNPGGGAGLVFAPPGSAQLPIADDPGTPGVIENTLGNIDTADAGVPAVADIRVRFTP